MALDSFNKQPYEVFWVSADFSNNLDSSEAIVVGSSAVTAMDQDGVDATSDVIVTGTITVSGDTLQIQVKGGTTAITYKLTFRATTDASPANKFELDVNMKVKEL